MRSQDHTRQFLDWWQRHGIDVIDLAVRRADGTWINHHHHVLPATHLLAWARAENQRRSDIYLRPARQQPWPHCFLDDLTVPKARSLIARARGLIVATSPRGGCHLHLILPQPITEIQRSHLQRALAARHGADPAATAGCQFQRLPGMRNWKRGGCWVNVLAHSHANVPPLITPWPLTSTTPVAKIYQHPHRPGCDTSPSGHDWAIVCRRLERGDPPASILIDLTHTATERRGRDAQRYAQRTLTQAHRHLSP